MEENGKRPKRVWLIFIWFIYGGAASFYQVYKISTGNVELPPGVEQPSGIIYYLQAVGFQLLAMVAATLMFLRLSVNRWVFSFMLGASLVSMLFTVLSGGVPEQQFTTVIAGMVFSLGIYALITWYSFILLASGYYKDTHNKSSQKNQ
jgi:hypothetical protein